MNHAQKNGWDKFDVYLYPEMYQADLEEGAQNAGFTVAWPRTIHELRDIQTKIRITAPSGEGGDFSCWLLLWSGKSVEDFFWENF